MRVALYARYSTDHQRHASIADQFRVCREYVTRQPGWTVRAEYADEAMSGASTRRPQYLTLLQEALRGTYDVVLAESLDRFSRDQEDTAGLYKRLQFAGVKIVTVSEGDITRMHVGLKGTMNALYLDELADKTRRGLRGRVAAGKSGGGLCYGYRAVRVLAGQPRGDRTIDEAEAATVRRIFKAFADGDSPKAIAKDLNRAGVPGPMGRVWSPSTINGHAIRGTGILNNDLYLGRLIWNKLRYVKNPDTGRRLSRHNPRDQWVTTMVPELRIVDDELWQKVKARQGSRRHTLHTAGLNRLHEPKYLFSGLTKCGVCGGGFSLQSHDQLVCFNRHERGTCTNRRRIKRQDIETRVLAALKAKLFEPSRFARICRVYTWRVNRAARSQRMALSGTARELASVTQQIGHIVEAVKRGLYSDVMRQELVALEAKKATLQQALESRPAPSLHPAVGASFRLRVERLAEGLQDAAYRAEARTALRGILERIVIPAGDGQVWLEGHLGALIGAPASWPGATVGLDGCGGAQPSKPPRHFIGHFRLVA